MELVLTGNQLSAEEAEKAGLVSKVIQGNNDKVVEEAVKLGEQIASYSQPVIQMAKEAVNKCKQNKNKTVFFKKIIIK